MARKDIYKVDNYFITIGIILFVIGMISIFTDPRTYFDLVIRDGTSYTFENKDGRTLDEVIGEKRRTRGYDVEVTETGKPVIRTIITINGLILLIVGVYYRTREKKIIKVWRVLEMTGETKVDDLVNSLGIERKFILHHLRDINNQNNAFYVYDQGSDKIVDGKLRAEYAITVGCAGCGNTINAKVRLDLTVLPKCSYCGTAIPVEQINKIKQEVHANRQALAAVPEKKGINVGILILLLIVFWPGAIIYAIKAKS